MLSTLFNIVWSILTILSNLSLREYSKQNHSEWLLLSDFKILFEKSIIFQTDCIKSCEYYYSLFQALDQISLIQGKSSLEQQVYLISPQN